MSESKRQLSKYTAIFASGTMLSRVTGLLRAMVLGYVIPSVSLDSFLFGFRFPNMLRDIVGEGASNAAFIPVLSETLEKEGEKQFREAVSAMMSAMIIVLAVLSILGILFMPAVSGMVQYFSHLTHEQISVEKTDLMMSLSRWIFPYIFFIGLTVFQMGPLFILRHYSTPAWSPALLNICLILTCWKGFGRLFPDPAYGLVVGVWLGGMSQFLVQYIALGRRAQTWLPHFNLRHPAIRVVFWLWVPIIIGQSAGEVNKFVDTMFAGSMEDGTVKVLMFANWIVQLPLSIFGLAISAVILPSITRSAAREEIGHVRDLLMHGFRQTYFLILPAIMALVVIPRPVASLLFERGHFGAYDTDRTGVALAYYAAGLLCFAWVKVAVTGFYAVKNTRTPVTAAFASMMLNIILIFLFVPGMGMGYRGLALATTLSYTINFVLLYILLWKRYGALYSGSMAVSLLKTTVASGIMAVALYYVAAFTQHVLPGHYNAALQRTITSIPVRLVWVFVPMTIGGIVYLAVNALLKAPELALFSSLLNRAKPSTKA